MPQACQVTIQKSKMGPWGQRSRGAMDGGRDAGGRACVLVLGTVFWDAFLRGHRTRRALALAAVGGVIISSS
jgi:hypothetical protein